ncbi:hypothetical protein OS493_019992 [Desmophyllum pertusum]|uniref:PDZ domain-containing protein n=1 Tax=Desmophyllum pertusum TaxID=174260 RepID=A0A9X0CFW6_9CNID|nr:hypothetical protein OS493_019992 [Desmophyllum pertusum]
MAMQNGSSSSGVLWERAKELLKKDDYERLKIAIKTFSKTRSVEGLCSDLLKIVNSRSKVDILTEVRRCLPKNQRNNFTRHCNELLETEAERERGDLEKKRKIEAKGILERENSAPNFQGSPAKKTRQDREKPLSSRTEKIASQGTNKLASDCSKEPANQARKLAHLVVPSALKENSNTRSKALNQGFGLRIRGGTFHQPSITVAQVAKDSLAERQGLKAGDRIIRVNDKRCGRGGVDIAQVIGIIKGSETLRMRVVSADVISKDDCKVQDVAEAKGSKPDGKIEEKRLSTVCVYPDEDGWLGCCIRGGTDYACDVHVISVDSCSPAERAGVKAGDVNGTSTKHLTHVQVVRLVISSGPCVTFSVKPACKQRKRSSRRQQAGVRPTPLRTQHRGQHDVTPPGSPTFKRFHLPGYPHHKQRGTAVDSPSQLPFDVMHLDCMPPPYTPEVPSRHRVLARGEEEHGGREGQEPQGTSHQQEPQDTNYNKKNYMTTLTHKNHRLPHINKNQRTPITNKDHMTASTHKNHRKSLSNKNHRTPLTNKYPREPLINKYPREPLTNKNHKVPLTYKNHRTPITINNHRTPITNKDHVMSCIHREPLNKNNHRTPLTNENPSEPLTNKNHRKSIVEKLPWRSLMMDSHQMHLVF